MIQHTPDKICSVITKIVDKYGYDDMDYTDFDDANYQILQHSCHHLILHWCCTPSYGIKMMITTVNDDDYDHFHDNYESFIIYDANDDLVRQVPYVVDDVDDVQRRLGNWTIENRENTPENDSQRKLVVHV